MMEEEKNKQENIREFRQDLVKKMHIRNAELREKYKEDLERHLDILKSGEPIPSDLFEEIKGAAYSDVPSLSDKQKKFVEYYMAAGGQNAAGAATQAGYSKGGHHNTKQIGYLLLNKNPKIARIVEVMKRDASLTFGLSKPRLIANLQSEVDFIKADTKLNTQTRVNLIVRITELQSKMLGYLLPDGGMIQNNIGSDGENTVTITLGNNRKFNTDRPISKNYEKDIEDENIEDIPFEDMLPEDE